MKEGWQIKKLGEVCTDFIVPQRDKPKRFDGDIPWCRIEDIEGKYLNGSLSGQKVTKALADSMNMHICPKGTVICACSASIGNQAITTVDCYTNQTFIGIVPEPNLIYNEFLYYFFKSKKEELIRMGTGSTIKYISRKKFEDLIIRFPSIEEQLRIVEELELLEGIIDSKNAQLRDLDTLAESLYYELFGDPVINSKKWPICAFGDICNSELGKMLDTKRAKGERKPYLCTINVLWDRIDLSTQKEMLFESDELDRYSVRQGDLLICEGGDIGRSAIWEIDTEMYYQNSIHRVRFDERKMLPIVMLYTFKLLKERGELDKYGKGQTIKHLVKKTLLSIPVIMPEISVQRGFAKRIEAIKESKRVITESLLETQLLFDKKLHDYFDE